MSTYLETREKLYLLTEDQWKAVYAMEQILANGQTDVNEVGKAITYLRAFVTG
ncbi:MAG: hypothetical protein SAL70_18680 [Scytonema sp. PMC 1070.18]|nr:hypothetical protein [Scytonema sp. PMC 1070.18]